jgi:hypothetical protein
LYMVLSMFLASFWLSWMVITPWRDGIFVSASSPLVGFGELNDDTIKDLTSLRSVEQEIEYCIHLWIVKWEVYIGDIPHIKLDWSQHSYQEDIQAIRITILKKWFFNGCLIWCDFSMAR